MGSWTFGSGKNAVNWIVVLFCALSWNGCNCNALKYAHIFLHNSIFKCACY